MQNDLIISDFEDTGKRDGIITKINEWFYHSLGEEAFEGGRIPHRLSTDEFFYKANARLFYEKAKQNKLPAYTIHRWGAGTLLRPVTAFLKELEELNNGKEILSKTKYIFSDYSQKIVDDAKRDALKNQFLKHYIGQGTLTFEVIDALNPPDGENIFNIESSYLYDSLPETIIEKKGDEFFHVQYRAFINESKKLLITDSGYPSKKIELSPEDLAKIFRDEDWDSIKRLTPETFEAIDFEQKLVQCDIDAIPNGSIIKEGLSHLHNARVSCSQSAATSLTQVSKSLAPGGYIQIFDITSVMMRDGKISASNGNYQKLNGALFIGINFYVLQKVAESLGLNWSYEHSVTFLERSLSKKTLSLIGLSLYFDEGEGKKYFEGDTSQLDEFRKKLQGIIGGVDAPQIWLFEDDNKTLFHTLLKDMGYDVLKIINQLIQDREIINNRLNYFCFNVTKPI